jgi:hypothetical protein
MRLVPARIGPATKMLPLLGLLCLAASAQTGTDLQAYSTEVTVPLEQIGAAPPPNVPVNLLQAVQGGALEIRHSLTYISTNRRLSVRTFLVAPASPNPTPPVGQTNLVESYEVNVESLLWASQAVVPPGTTTAARTSLVITGRIAGGSTSVFGDLTNALFVHSLGYDNSSPKRFNNITTLVSGMYTLYATGGTGTLTIAGQGPGGGTGDNRPPTAQATAGVNATTALLEIELDASGSADPENGPLTYAWRTIGKSAAIINGNTARPRVQFGEGFGDYMFEVTVTDNRGAFATATVTVRYVGR